MEKRLDFDQFFRNRVEDDANTDANQDIHEDEAPHSAASLTVKDGDHHRSYVESSGGNGHLDEHNETHYGETKKKMISKITTSCFEGGALGNLVTGGVDGRTFLWNVQSEQCLQVMRMNLFFFSFSSFIQLYLCRAAHTC